MIKIPCKLKSIFKYLITPKAEILLSWLTVSLIFYELELSDPHNFVRKIDTLSIYKRHLFTY